MGMQRVQKDDLTHWVKLPASNEKDTFLLSFANSTLRKALSLSANKYCTWDAGDDLMK